MKWLKFGLKKLSFRESNKQKLSRFPQDVQEGEMKGWVMLAFGSRERKKYDGVEHSASLAKGAQLKYLPYGFFRDVKQTFLEFSLIQRC